MSKSKSTYILYTDANFTLQIQPQQQKRVKFQTSHIFQHHPYDTSNTKYEYAGIKFQNIHIHRGRTTNTFQKRLLTQHALLLTITIH